MSNMTVDYRRPARSQDTIGVLRYHEAGDGRTAVYCTVPVRGDGLAELSRQPRVLRASISVAWYWNSRVSVSVTTSVATRCWTHKALPCSSWMRSDCRTVDVIGNSMGGGVGINFATHHSDRSAQAGHHGGIGTADISSPGPRSEESDYFRNSPRNPTRQRLIDWLRSMVYSEALVTEELIAERWELATDPENTRRGTAHVRQMPPSRR